MVNLTGKRLLILGGAVQQLPVVQTAKRLGIYTIVADIAENTEAKHIADEALNISVTDYDKLIEWCRNNPVDGCLNFNNDFAQKSHYYICSAFGFPCYGTENHYATLTDKISFKKKCQENGVSIIPGVDENNIHEAIYPVMVKPSESSGSRGSVVCGSQRELLQAIEKAHSISRNGKVLIEQYIPGRPNFEVLYFIHEYEPYLIYLADRYQGDPKDGLERVSTCMAVPSRFQEQYMQGTHQKVCRMLKNMEIKEAPVFLECLNENDDFKFYDPSIRFSGDLLYTFAKKMAGVDFAEIMIEFALTGKCTIDREKLSRIHMMENHKAAVVLVNACQGKIERFEGMDLIREMPSTVCTGQRHREGDIITKSGDIEQRVCEFVKLIQGDWDALAEDIRNAANHLCVEDETGNNMIISLFDPSVL